MKRKLFTIVLAASVSVLSFTGCKKDAAAPGKGGSTKDKLVGSYKMTELFAEVDGDTENILDQYASCDRDNLYVLKADMTTQVIDAGEQCEPSSNDTGTWSMPDESTIVMDGQTWDIESINGSTLKMTVDAEQDGKEVTYHLTYVKQ